MGYYNPARWYWVVAEHPATVFSSEKRSLVLLGDPEFQAWVSAGNTPTRIKSYDELLVVLSSQHPEAAPALTPYLKKVDG